MSIFQRDRRVREALQGFQKEMLEKSHKQDENIKEQGRMIAALEVSIAELDGRVLKLELATAQQDQTIQDVNTTTGIVAKDSGNTTTVQLLSSVSKSPGDTASPASQEENVVLITGGYRSTSTGISLTNHTEIYPRSSGCSPPPLPRYRASHNTFVTSDPTPVVATCGGHFSSYTSSCLVLDSVNQSWESGWMGNLRRIRMNSASVTLSNIGVFIIGGIHGHGTYPPHAIYNTSEFLPPGTMQWQEGPSLPVQMEKPLAVQITNTSFLVIHRTSIFEFDAAIAGPTSYKGWAEATKWPRLEPRMSRSCGKVAGR